MYIWVIWLYHPTYTRCEATDEDGILSSSGELPSVPHSLKSFWFTQAEPLWLPENQALLTASQYSHILAVSARYKTAAEI